MSRFPIITGIGMVTPLGNDAEQTWDALLAGRFISDHARTTLDGKSADRINVLATHAAREAIEQAKWPALSSTIARTALVVGTSKGAIETWITAPPHMSQSAYVSVGAQSLACDAAGLASAAARIGATFPLLDGPSLTVSAACASGLHALIRAAMMIGSGEADRVLIVAAEASVHPLFLASFKRLGVLPREGWGCRPFDQQRDGFLMSEAAAAVCLEAAEIYRAGDGAALRKTYARIDRFALGGDAHHMTGGDPHGKLLRRLLHQVVDGRPVNLIHAHGTGTAFHDPLELAAFEDEFASDASPPPAVYTHKGALGHSLGAAGLVSIALNCLMHERGIVPGNVQTRDPLPTHRLRIGREARNEPIRRSATLASGFGGPVAAVSLVSP